MFLQVQNTHKHQIKCQGSPEEAPSRETLSGLHVVQSDHGFRYKDITVVETSLYCYVSAGIEKNVQVFPVFLLHSKEKIFRKLT